MNREYYSIKEVAEKLNVHYNTVVKLINNRKIAAVKICAAWRISGIALDEYIKKHTIKAV